MPTTTEFQRARRRREVARGLLEEKTYAEMAEELCVSKSTIHNDVQRLQERWRDEADQSVKEQIDGQLARFKLMRAEAFESWRESREGPSREEEKWEGEAEDEIEKITRKVVERVGGDPSFLRLAFKAEKHIQTLLSLTEATPHRDDGESRIEPLVEVIEATAEDLDLQERFADEPIR